MTNSRLRLAFAGTPILARVVLESLIHKNEHSVQLVFTQPDRPAGRGRKMTPSEVKICALENKLSIIQPATPKEFDPDCLDNIDLLLVVAYGLILPAEMLNKPKYGCINIHTSLLPRWRGAAPIRRAIKAGDKETGITFMQMDTGLDTGSILLQEKCQIHAQDTGGILYDRLAEMSKNAIHPLLHKVAKNEIHTTEQDSSLVCYANKITKQEARLDWTRSAIELERKVRAFNPSPITHTELNGIKMRVWETELKPGIHNSAPGTILKDSRDSIDVVTADGILSITKLQLPGKKVISAKDFLNSHPVFIEKQLSGSR